MNTQRLRLATELERTVVRCTREGGSSAALKMQVARDFKMGGSNIGRCDNFSKIADVSLKEDIWQGYYNIAILKSLLRRIYNMTT